MLREVVSMSESKVMDTFGSLQVFGCIFRTLDNGWFRKVFRGFKFQFQGFACTLPRIVYFLKFDLYDDLIDVPIMHQIIERFTLSNIKIV